MGRGLGENSFYPLFHGLKQHFKTSVFGSETFQIHRTETLKIAGFRGSSLILQENVKCCFGA